MRLLSKEIQLNIDQPGEPVIHKRQDSVSDGLELALDVMVIIHRRSTRFERFRAGFRHQVTDPSAVLVLPRSTFFVVVSICHAGRSYMRWHIAVVVIQATAQALTIDQQFVQLTREGLADITLDVILVGLGIEDA